MFTTDTRGEARHILERLENARSDYGIRLHDLAVVFVSDEGKVKVAQPSDVGIRRGGVRGGAIAALVGLAAAPSVIPARINGDLSRMVAELAEKGIDRTMMDAIGGSLERGACMVLALGPTSEINRIARLASDLERAYISIPAEERALVEEISKLEF